MGDARAISPGTPTAKAQTRCRCVVLIGHGNPVPLRLIKGLRQRGAEVVAVADAPEAMVALAEGSTQVLIVNEPQSVRRLEQLLTAVRCYHPATRSWQYTTGPREHVSLNPLDPEGEAPKDQNAESMVQNRARRPAPTPDDRPRHPRMPEIVIPPSIRAFQAPSQPKDRPAPVPNTQPARKPEVDAGSPLVTAEEMAMLLGHGMENPEDITKTSGEPEISKSKKPPEAPDAEEAGE